jgi:hypothetical protein
MAHVEVDLARLDAESVVKILDRKMIRDMVGEDFEFAVVEGYQPHYRPDSMFVDMNAWSDKTLNFKRFTVSLPKLKPPLQLATLSERKLYHQKYYDYETKNLVNTLRNGMAMTMGTDPEIFVVDGAAEDSLIPAFKFLPAEKAAPKVAIQVPYAKNSAFIGEGSTGASHYVKPYWDGFQAEVSMGSASCLAQLSDDVYAGLAAILQAARAKYPKAKLSLQSVVEITPKMMKGLEEEYLQLGCKPSENIYGKHGQPVPDGRRLPVRFAGGHVHLGVVGHSVGYASGQRVSTLHAPSIESIVKAIDAIAGVACVSFFAKWDSSLRRAYYGLAGEYRLPPHGIEYRTLSNAWLMHPATMHITFDLVRAAARFGYKRLNALWTVTPDRAQDIVNNCDVDEARAALKENKDLLIKLLESVYSTAVMAGGCKMRPEDRSYAAPLAYEALLNGAESVIEKPEDIEGNWCLTEKGGWASHTEGEKGQWLNHVQYLRSGQKI